MVRTSSFNSYLEKGPSEVGESSPCNGHGVTSSGSIRTLLIHDEVCYKDLKQAQTLPQKALR